MSDTLRSVRATTAKYDTFLGDENIIGNPIAKGLMCDITDDIASNRLDINEVTDGDLLTSEDDLRKHQTRQARMREHYYSDLDNLEILQGKQIEWAYCKELP